MRVHHLLFGIVAISSVATSARADDDDDYELFHYKIPPRQDWLRAILEESFVLGLGFADQMRGSAQWSDFEKSYQWDFFRKKLVGKNQGFDDNPFDVNMIGHPLKGTYYYSPARSNHLSILESSAFAVISSLLWEYLGEANEPASINDMIVTPVAGISIGESLIQLGTYFDRQPPTFFNRLFGTLFAPVKTAHDLLDHAKLDRCTSPCGPWHRFSASLNGGIVSQGPALHPQVTTALETHLVNLPQYDAPGRHSHGWSEGNVSTIRLRAAFGVKDVNDALMSFHMLPIGWYWSDMAVAPSGRVAGLSGFTGIATQFEYHVHEWDLDGPVPNDQISHVSMGPSSELVARVGGMRIESRLDATVGLGAVRTLVLTKFRTIHSDEGLPNVVKKQGYDFALATILTPSVVVSYGHAEVGVRGRFGFYRGILGAEADQASLAFDVPRADRELEGSVWMAWAATKAIHIVATGRAAERASSLGDVNESRTELAAALGTEVQF